MQKNTMFAALVAAGLLAAAGTATAASSHMSRSDVQQVQRALNDAGYNVAVDGAWGPNTQRALRDYQSKHGLSATGRMDRDTMASLNMTPSHRMSGSSGTYRERSPSSGGSAGVNHMGSGAKGSRTQTDTLTNPQTVR